MGNSCVFRPNLPPNPGGILSFSVSCCEFLGHNTKFPSNFWDTILNSPGRNVLCSRHSPLSPKIPFRIKNDLTCHKVETTIPTKGSAHFIRSTTPIIPSSGCMSGYGGGVFTGGKQGVAGLRLRETVDNGAVPVM